jgi:hypothetical protein
VKIRERRDAHAGVTITRPVAAGIVDVGAAHGCDGVLSRRER